MEDKHPGLNEVIVPARRRQAGDPPPEGPGDTGGPRPAGPGTPPRPGSGFDLNRPTIVAMLYLSALALGITGVVGVVLAYVWRSEQPDGWEASHYTYLIRGFWLWLAGCVVGILLLVVFIGAVHPARRFRPDRDPRDPVDHPRAEPRADAQPGDLARLTRPPRGAGMAEFCGFHGK